MKFLTPLTHAARLVSALSVAPASAWAPYDCSKVS